MSGSGSESERASPAFRLAGLTRGPGRKLLRIRALSQKCYCYFRRKGIL
jgi:hypothetical protein